ncbi:hypothetical protein KUL118_66680 [Tenacibaculum sp. KUL118]|nr:hypothetical protein KUL118_66680 [Tenacibaculum sp. KUL118]
MNFSKIEKITEDLLKSQNICSVDEINLKKVCKSMNINLKSEDLDDDISGLFVVKEDSYFIRYNKRQPKTRKRFTIAHELGHYVLHKNIPLFVDKTGAKVLYRDNNSSTGEVKREREANAFAASLLMPAKFIESEINKIPDDMDEVIEYLAERFNVSLQAMTYRLANLNYDIGYF